MSSRRSRSVCVVRQGYFPDDPRVRKQVLALLESGFSVDVVCIRREGEAAREQWRGARIHRLPVAHHRRGIGTYLGNYVLFFARAFAKVSALHVRRRFAAVQVNTMPDALVFAALVPKLTGAKIVLDLQELMPELFRSSLAGASGRIIVPILQALEKLAVRFADHVLIVSQPQLEVVRKRTKLDRFTFVPNVPDDSVFDSETAMPERPANGTAPVLITHATLVERYGVQVLLRAIPHIRDVDDVHVMVVGDGEYLPVLRELAASLGIDASVTFTGRVPFEDMPKYLQDATIGVIPSIMPGYMEFVTPNKLFEYVAVGLPVVASDTPGLRAHFGDDALQYFPAGDERALADSVLAVLRSGERRESMVRRARAAFEPLRWEVTKARYTAAFDELLRAPAQRPAAS